MVHDVGHGGGSAAAVQYEHGPTRARVPHRQGKAGVGLDGESGGLVGGHRASPPEVTAVKVSHAIRRPSGWKKPVRLSADCAAASSARGNIGVS
ncbi:hypothetical protein SANTM175S_02014 [Streptomyces antimycoticus]